MSDNNNLPKPLAVVIGITTSIISFITAIVGFILLWKGNSEIVNTVVIVVGAVSLWASSLYIWFAKKTPRTKRKQSTYTFTENIRAYALIGIVIIPVFTIIGFQYNEYLTTEKEKAVIISIMEFDGPNSQKYGVNQFLIERINEGTDEIAYVDINTIDYAISPSNSEDTITEIRKKYKTDILVWGWYVASDKGINVTYHIVEFGIDPNLNPSIPFDYQTNMSATTEEVNTFEFQSNELADNIVFDTQRAVFHAYQTKEKTPDEALEVVDKALHFLENHSASFSNYDILYANVLSARASVYYYIHGFDRSLEEVNKAISISPSHNVYNNRGDIYARQGMKDEAINDYLQALKYPLTEGETYTSSYLRIGSVFDQKKDFNSAINYYTEGIQRVDVCTVANHCYLLYYRRGLDFLMVGDKASAEADFSKIKSVVNDPSRTKFLDEILANYKN